jgi:hypothetical protein
LVHPSCEPVRASVSVSWFKRGSFISVMPTSDHDVATCGYRRSIGLRPCASSLQRPATRSLP